jgi:hypothetical protein
VKINKFGEGMFFGIKLIESGKNFPKKINKFGDFW